MLVDPLCSICGDTLAEVAIANLPLCLRCGHRVLNLAAERRTAEIAEHHECERLMAIEREAFAADPTLLRVQSISWLFETEHQS